LFILSGDPAAEGDQCIPVVGILANVDGVEESVDGAPGSLTTTTTEIAYSGEGQGKRSGIEGIGAH